MRSTRNAAKNTLVAALLLFISAAPCRTTSAIQMCAMKYI